MKRTYLLITWGLLLFLLHTTGCNKPEDGSYAPPITRYEKIAGTWKLTGLVQTDELAKATGGALTEMNLYSKLGFKNMAIIFSSDAQNNPTTFKVEGANVPALFAKEGYWQMDSPFTTGKVGKLFLYADAGKTQLLDELEVVTIPGTNNVLELKLIRSSEGTPYLSYLLSLKPE